MTRNDISYPSQSVGSNKHVLTPSFAEESAAASADVLPLTMTTKDLLVKEPKTVPLQSKISSAHDSDRRVRVE